MSGGLIVEVIWGGEGVATCEGREPGICGEEDEGEVIAADTEEADWAVTPAICFCKTEMALLVTV
ncbi:peptidase [Sesbania bispinosa]|nr:peptidase [Sesbania bispinosa]